MNYLTIIKDYRGAFYSSSKNVRTYCSMNLEKLFDRFTKLGWETDVIEYPDINFTVDWSDRIVLYQSAEDINLEYKSYIEDIILGLSLAGAIIVPEFPFLRAHHNKVFMEILRKTSNVPEANTLSSTVFGTFEDFKKRGSNFPVVAKISQSSGSRGVVLLNNQREALDVLRKLMRSSNTIQSTIRELAKRLVINGYIPYSLHRRKLIMQEYIPNLTYDYKILIYGKRFYVLKRLVRKNDFRASGSGYFSWPRELPVGLLDFAQKIFSGFDVPNCSFDIAESNSNFHLIEAQFIDFGPLTLEESSFYWIKVKNNWRIVETKSELESTFAEGVTDFAKRKGWFK